MYKVDCSNCGEPAKCVKGSAIYPDYPDQHKKWFWVCECGARVGCHPGTQKPLGTLATRNLRHWRWKAHQALDRVWKGGRWNRRQAYLWLCEKMNMSRKECHIGLFNISQCKEVVRHCQKFRPTKKTKRRRHK